NPCTLDDACNDQGVCEGTAIDCAPLDECHQAGVCDAMTATCSDPRKPDGAECGGTGRCDKGQCVGGTVTEDGGAGNEGSGGSDTSSGGGEGTDPNKSGGLYSRDPSGCSLTAPVSPRSLGSAGVGLLLLGLLVRRRRTK